MRLLEIGIKGVLAFREEMRLDLRRLPPGLIAIVGRNGEGKTTILETPLAALAREFPSRHESNIFDYATRQDAYLEAILELEGRGIHRARLNLDGIRRCSTAALGITIQDGTEIEVGGKSLAAYDAEVAKILPPIPLLLASVFAAQGRQGSFSQLDTKGRRALMSELLGLSHLETLSERAKQAATILASRVALIEQRIAEVTLGASPSVEAILVEADRRLDGERANATNDLARTREALATLEAQLASSQEEIRAHDSAKVRLDAIRSKLAAAQASLLFAVQSRERFERDAAQEWRERQERYRRDRVNLEESMRDKGPYTRTRAQIDAAFMRFQREQDRALAERRLVLGRRDEIAFAAGAVKQAEAIDMALASLRERCAQLTQARAELSAAQRSAALLDGVPCGGQGEYAVCVLLMDATAARDRLPALQATVDNLTPIEAEAEALTQARPRLTPADRAFAAEEALVAHADADIEKILAAKRDAITAHANDLDALEKEETRRQSGLNERITLIGAELESANVTAQRVYTESRGERSAEIERLEMSIQEETRVEAEAQADVDRLRPAFERADAVGGEIRMRRANESALTSILGRISGDISAQTERWALFFAAVEKLKESTATRTQLHTDLLEWQDLQAAFARDGLQIIEIDQAGPTVSSYTNQLLAGTEFTVELVTLEPLKTKSKDGRAYRDAFELKVFDSKRGGTPRNLEDLSGGQRVVVDEALKSAIALYLNARSPHPIRTAWRDETTGALHPDAAWFYMDMLRKVYQLGGFEHLFYVTHNQEAALAADAQIVVADGACSIRFPPYPFEESTESDRTWAIPETAGA